MAKGARASTIKANNSKLKSRVFGPIETARTERLSAKLLELAAQPKPQSKDADIMMDTESGMFYFANQSLYILTENRFSRSRGRFQIGWQAGRW